MFDDNFFDLILDGPFTWDKNAYRFNRTEKDMHPYSVVNGKETLVIVHNVLGVDKKDLKLTIKNENEEYNNMSAFLSPCIHLNDRTDHQHTGSCRSDATGKQCSKRQKAHIDPWRTCQISG